jgi:hypothetical protein
MAGTAGNNTTPATDGPSGYSASPNDAAFEDMPKEMLKLFKDVDKYVDSILKKWDKSIKGTKDATKELNKDKPGGSLGLGSFSRSEKAMGVMMVGAAIGKTFMGMAPDTMAAVTQRLGADSYAGLSGLSSRQAILRANKMVGGGATSAMGPTMAAMATMYGGGYTATSVSSKNIMQQLGGLSAMTGASNEEAAASVAGMNGMNFLRLGVRIRDDKGNLRPMNQIINETYNALYRGQKITKEQAALILNPGSKGYKTLQMITGGDVNLMKTLQMGIIARAQGGKAITSAEMKDPNKMLDRMGVDESSPQRANFRYQSSEARKLGATEEGLVGGYNVSLRTTASLNDAYSTMADLLGPVNDGLMTLKGILQTLPQTGNMGGTVAGMASTAASLGTNLMMYKMMMGGKGGGGGGGFGGFFGGKGGGTGAGLPKGGGFGKFGRMTGLGLVAAGGNIAANYLDDHVGGSKSLHNRGMAAASIGTSAATGAAIGSILPGPGTAVGAVLGTIWGLMKNGEKLVTGEDPNGGENVQMNLGGAESSPAANKKILPVPKGTTVSSAYGPRSAAAAKAAKEGRKISSYHHGIDYKVPSGTSIVAMDSGVVVETGNQPSGYGNYVTVKHADGTKTRYAHLRQIGVAKDQKVSAGQVIGKSGGGVNDPGKGNSGGAHLHFEILNKAGVRVDPATWLLGADATSLSGILQTSTRTKNFLTNGYNAFDPSGKSYSSPELSTILGETGSPIDFSTLQQRYSGAGLESLLNSARDPYSGKVTTNKKQLMRTIAKQGFGNAALKTAYAVAIAESGGRSNAIGDVSLQDDKWGPSIGLFQIRSLKNWQKWNDEYRDAKRLPNPDFNAQAAWVKSKQGTNWKPWSAYTNAAFLKHLPEADKIAEETHLGGPMGDSMNLGAPSSSAGHSMSGGSATVTTNRNVSIQVHMDVKLSGATAASAEQMVKIFTQKLEASAKLKEIGSSL